MNKENEEKMVLALAGILSALDEIAGHISALEVSLSKIEKAIKKIDSGVI